MENKKNYLKIEKKIFYFRYIGILLISNLLIFLIINENSNVQTIAAIKQELKTIDLNPDHLVINLHAFLITPIELNQKVNIYEADTKKFLSSGIWISEFINEEIKDIENDESIFSSEHSYESNHDQDLKYSKIQLQVQKHHIEKLINQKKLIVLPSDVPFKPSSIPYQRKSKSYEIIF